MASNGEMGREIRSEDELRLPFESAFAHGKRSLIGLEAEKFGVREDGTPVHYEGPGGVREILEALSVAHHWKQVRESEGAPLLALERDGASITLEPGAQLELSGAAHEDVHGVAAEVEQHRRELATPDVAPGVRWLGLGFHPWAKQSDLDWVPKSRYPVMREYLPTRGKYGLDMMRRTATVQANFDFDSEADMLRKLRISLALSPIVQAIFANSSLVEGKRSGFETYRGNVWTDVDNGRAGLLPMMWKREASLGDYVQWVLSAPLFIVKRGSKVYPATHLTFAQFLRDGIEGERATMSDWESHLSTVFPEVRIKRTLEVRSADGVPSAFGNALPALWTGVLYDPASLDAAEQLVKEITFEQAAAARDDIARHALAATSLLGGQTVRALAESMCSIASEGLRKRAKLDAEGRDERIYLDEVSALVREGKSVGQSLLEGYDPAGADAKNELFRRAKY